MAETQVRQIKIMVDARDSKGQLLSIQKGISGLNRSVKETTASVASFRNIFLGIQGINIAGFGLGSLVDSLGQVQKLGDRLKVLGGETESVGKTFESLTGLANENRISIEDTATAYTRLSLSINDLGASTEAVLGLTDLLQKTFRISGSTTAEATSATIQLSQALASGQLRGAELRSVLEANALVGDILAKSLGTTRGELIKFAEKRGGISAAEFLKAVSDNADDLNSKAKALQPTIREALTSNFNTLRVELFKLNEEFRLTEKAVSLIDFAFRNIDLAAVGVSVFAIYKAFGLATTAVLAFNGAILTLAASPVVGFLVKAGIYISGITVSAAAAAAALGLLAGGFATALLFSEDFRGSIAELGGAIKDRISQALMTQEELNDIADYRSSLRDATNETRVYGISQSELEKSLLNTAIGFRNGSVETLVYNKSLLGTSASTEKVLTDTEKFQKALFDFANGLDEASKKTFDYDARLAGLNEQYLKDKNVTNYAKALKSLDIEKLTLDFRTGKVNLEEYNKRLNEINFGKSLSRAKERANDLKELNDQFTMFGDVLKYSKALDELNLTRSISDFEEGRKSLQDLNKDFRDQSVKDANRAYSDLSITLTELNATTRQLTIDELNEQFRTGTIDVYEYNRQLTETSEKFQPGSALFTGTANYIKQAGTISQNIANGITNTFGTLEDFFVDFTKTGKFAFRDFAISVLDDLNRIIIRSLIIRPLAEGILGSIGGAGGAGAAPSTESSGFQSSFGNGNYSFKANGGAYNKGVEFFANGGVFDSPTMFGTRGGLGVLGEAGPEAILPLKRQSNGQLGVQAEANQANVTVNIINQSGNEVQQRETTNARGDKILEVLILGTVKEGFAGGSFDKQLKQQYGLNRRGA
jgi:lambda family phage tail tape measure protein